MRFVLVAIGAFALISCDSAVKTEDATAQLKPMMEKVMAAWQTLDVEKVAPYYAKDAKLTFYDITPLKYSGWQDYSGGFKKVAADWKSMELTVNPDFQASRKGDVAWATFTMDFVITPKEGEVMKGTGRNTEVLEKRGDNWVIVHEHVSVPMMEPPPKPVEKPVKAAKPKHKSKR